MTHASHTKITVEPTHEGRRLRILLRGGKGNVIDTAMCHEIAAALHDAAANPHLRCIAIEAEGNHFSFGASVPEHAPGLVGPMLASLEYVVVGLFRSPVPVTCAVRGACLGGGLEVVLPCHRIVATADAKLGCPEITLGMFAPAGSVLLPERVGRGLAEEMLLTGRILSGDEAKAAGLVDEIAADPEAAALRWFETNLLPRSASALRFATMAARDTMQERFQRSMARLGKTFVEDTMTTSDANEGIASFVEKRKPVWTDR